MKHRCGKWVLASMLMWVGAPTIALSQEVSRSKVWVEAGRAEMHGSPGPSGGLAWGRALGARRIADVELRLIYKASDNQFLSLGPGISISPFEILGVSPFVAAHGGLLSEHDFAGPFVTWGAGVRISVIRSLAARITFARGWHGGQTGP